MIAGLAEKQITGQVELKEEISQLDESLEQMFSDKLEVCRDLSRVLDNLFKFRHIGDISFKIK